MMQGRGSPTTWQGFRPTAWSVVIAAGAADTAIRREAMEELCRQYWYPLYAFVRRQGHNPQDSQDLVQGFLMEITRGDSLAAVHPDKGRFRTYLLACLKHYLSRQRRRRNARRRGGGIPPLSLDAAAAEGRFLLEPADPRSPDRWFDRAWAVTLLDSVLVALQEEYAGRGRSALFERLKPALTDPAELPAYAELGRELGLEEGAVKVAVHRIRKRYRTLLREAVAATLDASGQVDDEFAVLMRALAMDDG